MRVAKMIKLGMMGGVPYYRKILNLFGNSIIQYLPGSESAGSVAIDISGNGLNGSYAAGVILGQPGIGDGRTSSYHSGTSSSLNAISAGLISKHNGAEGTMIINSKIPLSNWSDGADGAIFQFAKSDYSLPFNMIESNNQIIFGALGKTYSLYQFVSINWMQLILTWSNSSDEIIAYFNGSKIGRATGLTAWGANALGKAFFGGLSASVSLYTGYQQNRILLNRAITQDEVLKTQLYPIQTRISIIGDSIPAVYGWPYMIQDQYGGGHNYIMNHAVAGNSITGNMATQVAAAANDNANIIIHELGTNDDNNGNMATLQATIEAGIAALKISNPNAIQYYMGVLPRWTNSGGGTVVDKSNIRTAQQAACVSQGITYWDMFTTPVLVAADTSDGLHPIYTGCQKLTASVIALLL